MGKICRLTLALIIILTTALVGLRLLSPVPPPGLSLLFTNADGSRCLPPCLFGIRPGYTSLAQSITLLESHPFISRFTSRQQYEVTDWWSNSEDLVIFASPGAKVVVGAPNADAKVVAVSFAVNTNSLAGTDWATLGQVVADLGPPTFFSANTEMTYAYYVPQHIVIAHAHSSGWYTVNDQFVWLYLYDEENAFPPPMLPWRGWLSPARFVEYIR